MKKLLLLLGLWAALPALAIQNTGVDVSKAGGYAITTAPAGVSVSKAGAYAVVQAVPGQNGSGTSPLIVAVGTNVAASSPDGITWTARTIPAGTYGAVVWDGGKYVALTGGGVTAISYDGMTWSAGPSLPGGLPYTSLAYSDSLHLFAVTTSAASGTASLLTSPDLIAWTTRDTGGELLFRVIWAGGRFVAVGTNSSTRVLTSTDGVTWTASYVAQINSVAYNGSVYVTTGGATGYDSSTSTNASSWATHSSVLSTGNPTALIALGSKICALLQSLAQVSTDNGLTFARYTTPAVGYNGPASAAASSTIAILVGQTGGSFLRSYDCMTWTQGSIPGGGVYLAVVVPVPWNANTPSALMVYPAY